MKTINLLFFVACISLGACDHSPKPVLAPETIFDDKGMHVISSVFNKRLKTMSVLYGNELALNAAGRGNAMHLPGEVFKLVTWDLKPNPLWFGGNINGARQTIETVKVLSSENGNPLVDYEIIKGSIRQKYNPDQQQRIKFIFEQKASVFP